MKLISVKYLILFLVTIVVSMSSCRKGNEPVPQFDEGVSNEQVNHSSMREGIVLGDDLGDGIGDGIGDDGSGDGSDGGIIGGDDNEDDDDADVGPGTSVVVGSGVVVGTITDSPVLGGGGR